MKRQIELETRLASIPQEPYPKHSRIHLLKSFSNDCSRCYVKRDDELGFGISGSKLRKYRSLLPFFKANGTQEVVVIGSAYSNNVLGITQLLIENGIKPTLFLKQSHQKEKKGIFLLTNLFVDTKNIHFISSLNWKNVENIAQEYLQSKDSSTFILKEGASITEALPGALTLSLDITQNEIKNNINFDQIFIESGTGLMACALILGFCWLLKKCKIHVVLLAEDESYFLNQLTFFHEQFQILMQTTMPFPSNFVLHKPTTASAFGSTNKKIFDEIQLIAKQEGFLVDPIYSAKLFLTARQILSEMNEQNLSSLIVHSGGGLSLMGFQDNLGSFST